MEIIIGIIALVIIILFANKKSYREVLVFLTISLILDWIFVNLFSSTPLIKTIAIPLGNCILSVLIYVLIKLVCMGIFYCTLQKYNYIISLIVYLVINLIISTFYRTISGSILLDVLFNFIIGIIIIIVYRKNIEMEDIKWFAIIGMIMDAILAFLIGILWRIVGGTVFIYILIFGTLFMPYIIGAILSAITIYLLRKRLVNKSNKFKILVYVIVILVCGYVSVKAGYSFLSYVSAKPDKIYVEMNKINDNQSLIGLSKEQVIELLGEPNSKEDEEIYYYDAGKVTNYLFFGGRDFYELRIIFDENDKVKATSIKEIV